MSLAKSLGKAFQRSLDGIKQETAKAMRMEVAPTSRSEGILPIWGIRSRADLNNFATGSDKDIGGLSTCALSVDEASDSAGTSSHGRFYGTITTDIPRGSRIERSGYAAFRNRNRPTLFGQQTWDTTVHPLLALRVRNKFAKPVDEALKEAREKTSQQADSAASSSTSNSAYSSTVSSPSLRQALHATSIGRSPVEARAIHALGIGLAEAPGPKFFINIQTDGPVTSDLFQHRLYFDERLGDAWQTVVIPFDDFVLTNTGQVALSQVTMMRERIRTVGISVVLEPPTFKLSDPKAPKSNGAPSALRKQADSEPVAEGENDWAKDGGLVGKDSTEAPPAALSSSQARRGSRRGTTFNFDLGIDSVFAVGSIEELQAQSLL